MAAEQAVQSAAREWLLLDPDPETRAEVEELLTASAADGADAEAALDGLTNRFGARLEFGTAGLRGALGAGPNRMNRVVVSQTSAGLARFLFTREERPRVVIGYDGRKNSAVFAKDAAEIFAGAGIDTVLLPRLLPTPVLAFAVRHLDASAGVMVTASHNPAQDNGYKLYLGGPDEGSQIVPPADREVFDLIGQVIDEGTAALARSENYTIADESVVEAYIAATALPLPDTQLAWVYTPMHGVGWDTVSRVLRAAGAPEPTLVAEQVDPDPEFPTVAFPNPEEAGALDLAIATARTAGADVVLANDPDADRLAVVVRLESGDWEQLRGNEVGLLLADWAARRAASDGRSGSLAASIVSTPGLGTVARVNGLEHIETLTGFKWISRAPDLIYGFEEALGYLVDPDKVRDKDGISAAVAVLDILLQLHRDGIPFEQHRSNLVARYGWFGSDQISIRVTDLSEIGEMMSRVRSRRPESIGGVRVVRSDDLSDGASGLPASDVVRFWLDGGGRIILRPSGTEPKLKIYVDVAVEDGEPAGRPERGEALLAQLREGASALL